MKVKVIPSPEFNRRFKRLAKKYRSLPADYLALSKDLKENPFQGVDLGDNRNLFVVATILIAGIGGMSLTIGKVTLTEVACALILGIIVNLVCSRAPAAAPQADSQEKAE